MTQIDVRAARCRARRPSGDQPTGPPDDPTASLGLDDADALFESDRPRLMRVAHQILGGSADTEDVLQEAWLRWHRIDHDLLLSPHAFLTTVVTRLAVDRLRQRRRRREHDMGSWPLEHAAVDTDPAGGPERADTLALALLLLLETLSPLERAAFMLREVFGQAYPEVAAALGRDEPAVRQLVHRARGHVHAGSARYPVEHTTHVRALEAFLAACTTADIDALLAVVAPDVGAGPRQPRGSSVANHGPGPW